MAAITSTTPPSGRSRARLACAVNSQAAPPTSSTPATSAGSPTAVSGLVPPAAAPSGSTSCRRVACSSGGAFRQISTSPATLNICGQAQPANQPSLSAPRRAARG